MRGLGPLEASVMQSLWSATAPQTVRAVQEQLAANREIAYTTVMTVMDNLFRKGMLKRERQGRAYLYRPLKSREAYTAELLGDVLAEGGNRQGVLMHFVEHLDEEGAESLRRLLDNREQGHP